MLTKEGADRVCGESIMLCRWIRLWRWAFLAVADAVIGEDADLGDQKPFNGFSVAAFINGSKHPRLKDEPYHNEQGKQGLFPAATPFPCADDHYRQK